MSHVSEQTTVLSARRQALLEQRLRQKGIVVAQERTIPRRADAGPAPLSFAQQRLWFFDQLMPGSSVYNNHIAVRLSGAFDAVVLEHVMNEIVRRHEVLRTVFSTVDDQPVQIVTPNAQLTLRKIDLVGLSPTEQDTHVAELSRSAALQPFDLARELPLRAVLIRLADDDHVVLFTMHHIVSDAWSRAVLVQEVAALYQAFAEGRPSPLPDLVVQYADYACRQRDWLEGKSAPGAAQFAEQLAYWKQHLSGALPILALPTDRPRPGVQSHRGARHPLALSNTLTQQLRRLSQTEGVTLFMTLLAAFNAFLSRYTQQEDIIVGSPIGNRSRREIEGLIGFFVNTLALRTDVSGHPSFRTLLQRVRETCLGAYAHQDLPFEKLVEELRPEREMSHSPLFQVMFILQNAPAPQLELPGLTLSWLKTDLETAKFDLTFELLEGPDQISGSVEYNTDLFDAATIARMITSFETLLHGIVADPDQPVVRLPLLTDEARRRQLHVWNATAEPYPRDMCVHHLFEQQAQCAPNAIAVTDGATRLTYAELNRRANQFAHYLRTLGVGPEQRVGICVERSIDWVVGVLGIFKAGGAYVPLDPAYPRERLAYMITDSQSIVLLTQQRLLEELPEHNAHVVCIDTAHQLVANQPDSNPDTGVTPDHLAYVIYTSGSTGRPKGVAMGHRPLTNLIAWQVRHAAVPPTARTIQFASLSFDVSFEETFSTLCAGGALVVIAETLRRDPHALVTLLRDEAVERMFLPFVALQQLAEAVDAYGIVPTHLREIIPAGEQLRITPPIARLFQTLDACLLRNQYGPTESHTITSYPLRGAPDEWAVLPAIGRPLANMQLYILDAQLQPVPIGVPGELYVSGDCLARGYLNQPHLTAQKFIPNPFSDKPGDRMYKTGDLTRYQPDGSIEYLGRIDTQVKFRGFRVELGEIEAALSRHPAVQKAAVIAREDPPGAKRLVAYVVAQPESTPDTDYDQSAPTSGMLSTQLRAFLKEQLPDYMVPSAIMFLQALPLSPNGKVDRRALPEPSQDRRVQTRADEPPRTNTERQVADVWQRVLGLTQVGVHDNFFDLGGHSLLATQIIFRLREATGIDIPLRTLFTVPTVAGMAHTIEELQTTQRPCTTATLDLRAEVQLDETIRIDGIPFLSDTAPQSVFLTGATGFIGAFLVRDLLRQTRATLYCLVRAHDTADGRRRIQQSLQHYGIWNDTYDWRIVPVIGDLGAPRLGLSEPDFDTLAAMIDVVYHNGAFVNYTYPYSVLKGPNVLGTQEVLRLVSRTRIKPLHFVSTLGVFEGVGGTEALEIMEHDTLDRVDGIQLGYAQSKWVAEKLLMCARERGLPISVYRPGRVSGDSANGACQSNDFLWRLAKICIQMGLVPDVHTTVNVVPVDYVSRSIVHLSQTPMARDKAFHIVSPVSTRFTDLVDWMRAYGYRLTTVPHDVWLDQLREVAQDSAELAIFSLLLGAPSGEARIEPTFDWRNTRAGLADTAISCPHIDARLFAIYCDYFVRTGFLPAPNESAS